jgi:hypothetical protein
MIRSKQARIFLNDCLEYDDGFARSAQPSRVAIRQALHGG